MPFDHERAKKLVEKKYGTLTAAAGGMDLHLPYLSRLLAGKVKKPDLGTIERLAVNLECRLTTLLTPWNPEIRKAAAKKSS